MKTQVSGNEQSIIFIKNKVLNIIILATIPFGLVASFLALNRDFYVDFNYSTEFAFANFISIGLALMLYILRRKMALEIRILILASLYLIAGIRGMLELGSVSNPYILISISFLILQLMVNRKWMIIMILFAISIIIVIHFSSTYFSFFSDIDYNILMRSRQQWAADISMFTLLAFILILSVGNYHYEILNVLSLVKNKNRELDKKNQLLTEEIETRKRYESEVVITSKKFQTVFESSQDGIILTDKELKILEVNPAFSDITGFSREELLHNNILDILQPKNKSIILNRLFNLLDGEIQPLSELTIRSKGGEKITIEFNNNILVGDRDQLTIVTSIRNISSRKEIEDLKLNAVLEAEENERERFSKDLHDELGPLFSTVKLYVEWLKNGEENMEKVQVLDKLSEIVNNGVRQIREISHNLSPHLLREQGLKQAIETHLKWIKDTSSLETEYEFIENSSTVSLADKIQILIYRVFLELMNNSIKHSKASMVKIKVSIDQDWINFVFSDNGVGFDPNEESKLQTGIGLKNIINRIQAMNGEIVYSFGDWMKTEIKLPI